MGFPEKILNFFRIAKSSKFAVKCDWKHKASQNVQNLVLLKKMYLFFGNKMWFFWKNAEGSKFAVDGDWMCKISKRVQKLIFCWKQIRCVIRKKNSFQNRCNKFAVECHWIRKNLQKVRKFDVLKEMGFWLTKSFF